MLGILRCYSCLLSERWGRYRAWQWAAVLHTVFKNQKLTGCQCSDDFQTVTQMFWFIVGYRTVSLPRINCFRAWWSRFLGLKTTMTHLIKWHKRDSAWWMIFLGGSGEEQSGFQYAGSSRGRRNNAIIDMHFPASEIIKVLPHLLHLFFEAWDRFLISSASCVPPSISESTCFLVLPGAVCTTNAISRASYPSLFKFC